MSSLLKKLKKGRVNTAEAMQDVFFRNMSAGKKLRLASVKAEETTTLDISIDTGIR